MRLLLDTHIFLALANEHLEDLSRNIQKSIVIGSNERFLSVFSLWEIAIKHRLGKLPLKLQLDRLPIFAKRLELEIIPITADHALADIAPEPLTRDPFDRLLLAQCRVEDMRLVTIDRALIDHPLAVPN